jgi:GT2 family glycosyltransferase
VSAAPGVRALVLTYGTSGVHEELLASLRREGLEPSQILVVHNPADPGEPDPRLPDGVRLLRSERNLGYAGGMNLGLRELLGGAEDFDHVLLLSHDARLRAGALERLVAAAEASPVHGVLAPALMFAGTEQPFSFGGTTNRWGRTDHRRERPAGAWIADSDWVDGGTMLIRRDALAIVGGFDESFWGYCEESELCLRIRRAGYAIGVVPDAVADQDPGGLKRPGVWAYLLVRNGAEYSRRARGLAGLLGAAGRWAREMALLGTRYLVRTVRSRPGGREEIRVLGVGVGRGYIDFCRRRFGPPPADLPGSGDTSNV